MFRCGLQRSCSMVHAAECVVGFAAGCDVVKIPCWLAAAGAAALTQILVWFGLRTWNITSMLGALQPLCGAY